MVAYEIYLFDEAQRPHLIGVLPERREDPLRITRESVLDRVRIMTGDMIDVNNLYFVQREM
jgi:hypothetical protein